jgi:SAM-dependent methyltransferase
VHRYHTDFYDFLASFAARSAEAIVPLLAGALQIRSVADFGCGEGAWLSVWRKAGADVIGVDGPYIDRRRLMIEQSQFYPADLSRAVDLGRRFDLVQSLEVAEHLPAEGAPGFVATLTAHAPLVLFSAAVPGQGGVHHVNEQPLEYWRSKFRDRGYVAIDCIRPRIAGNPHIQSWYRRNMLLYAAEAALDTLPRQLHACRIADTQRLRDYRPLGVRIRHAIVRRLPPRAVDSLSHHRSRLAARRAATTAT